MIEVTEPVIRETTSSYVERPVTAQRANRNTEQPAASKKTSIRQSYIRAVVKDAVAKAQDNVSKGKFYKATEAVEIAAAAVKQRMDPNGCRLLKPVK